MKLFLQACCGPCFLGVREGLPDLEDLALFYTNPNMNSAAEEELRWQNLVLAAQGPRGPQLFRSAYEPDRFAMATAPAKGVFGERCLGCYRLRLEDTAKAALQAGFTAFGSTLLVSPWQNINAIKEIGEEVGESLGINFFFKDFRPWYRLGQQKARDLGLYRQKFCGCALSKTEAEAQRIERERSKAEKRQEKA